MIISKDRVDYLVAVDRRWPVEHSCLRTSLDTYIICKLEITQNVHDRCAHDALHAFNQYLRTLNL